MTFKKGGVPWIKGKHHTKESKQKISSTRKGQLGYWNGKHHTEKTKRKMSDAHSGNKNPMYGKKNIARTLLNKQRKGKFNHSDKTKRKISESLTGKYYIDITKEELKKMYETEKLSLCQISDKTGFSASALHNALHRFNVHARTISLARKGQVAWIVGRHHTEKSKQKISFANTDWDFYNEHGCTRKQYPYGLDWTPKLKKQIAERDGYTCQLCNEILPGRWGTHHIDYRKNNNNSSNLIFLCHYCHGKTNINRTFWEQYFKQLQIARGFGEERHNGSQTAIDR